MKRFMFIGVLLGVAAGIGSVPQAHAVRPTHGQHRLRYTFTLPDGEMATVRTFSFQQVRVEALNDPATLPGGQDHAYFSLRDKGAPYRVNAGQVIGMLGQKNLTMNPASLGAMLGSYVDHLGCRRIQRGPNKGKWLHVYRVRQQDRQGGDLVGKEINLYFKKTTPATANHRERVRRYVLPLQITARRAARRR